MKLPLKRKQPSGKMVRSRWRRVARFLLITAVAAYTFFALLLLLFRFVDPPSTVLRIQRRIEAQSRPGRYVERCQPVPLSKIPLHLQHAVIAAEDGNFYRHYGFDFQQIQIAIKDDLLEEGRLRGASTITQQLVKNLFFGTRWGFLRKGAEAALVPAAELCLGKKRILELYLNNAELGPGVFGVEAAARYYYRTSAARLSREQSARLAAILPSPLRRRPASMNRYSDIILRRMQILGW